MAFRLELKTFFNTRRKAHDKLKEYVLKTIFTLLKSHLQRRNLGFLDRDANQEDDAQKRL